MTKRNFPPRWLDAAAVEEADRREGRMGGGQRYSTIPSVTLGES